ncbi:MAG: VanZ family protein [Deltaproteobacteria bacterium]|nr:VanZ family protein [Deltaproteobacteria bacterium]MBI2531610.1 VanZ family protein [Deltaproteobacteria bacterium]
MTKALWRLLWIGWVLVIGAVTLLPWSNYVGHSHWPWVRWFPFRTGEMSQDFFVDFFANVLLFTPFGYLQLRAGLNLLRREMLSTVVTALALSLGVEFAQVYTHNRFASTADVLSNVMGAMLGELVYRLKLF